MPPIPLLISAGEASGDMYAARLAAALKQRADVQLFGMGGPLMRSAGVEIVTDYSEVAVVGITEILKHLPSLLVAMERLVDAADRRKPELAILTDFPGFHLRLARKLKPKGIRNVYYICPQFWAWRPWRVNLVRRRFAKALCIFPFEEKFFSGAGVPTKFVGHPLVGTVEATKDRRRFCEEYQLDASRAIVSVLPGTDAPVPWLVAETKAAGTTAPFASLTLPTKDPYRTWATVIGGPLKKAVIVKIVRNERCKPAPLDLT